jgi:O-antigen/teichoic acid export membrane protein
MGIVFRQSVKNLGVVVTGALLGALLIWMNTKYNTKQQFGSLRTMTNYAVQASQILSFGLSNTLAIFSHRYINDKNKKRLLITLCMGIPLVIFIFFSFGYFFLRTWILHHFQPVDVPFMQQYFMWIPLYTLFFIYMVVFDQYLYFQMKVAISAFMREVVLRIANIILLLLFGYGFIDFNVLVIGSVLIYIIPISIYMALSLKTKYFGFTFNLNYFSRSEYKELLHFSWYHFLLTVSIPLISTLDVLMLSIYDHKGFSAVAVYGVAIFFISFLQLPMKALVPASFAVLAKAFTEGEIEQARDIFIRASINILIPTIGIAILLCCNLQNAVAIIKSGYLEIIPVFLILFVGTLVNVACGMSDQVLSVTNYYKFNFYISLIIILVLFVMLRLLIPRYGIYGAAYSSAIASILFSVLKSLFVWRKLKMKPFTNKTILVFIAGLPALAAGYFFPYFFEPARHVYVHSFLDAVMRSSVIVIVYVAMLLWLKPSKDLEDYTASAIKNKRLF